MDENKLKQIIIEQNKSFSTIQKDLIKRDKLELVKKYIRLPHVIVISGIRRCGKSTLLKEIACEFYPDNYYYINFEDERLLNFKVEDFNLMYEILLQLFGEKSIFLIDEIQNIDNWESFIRRFYDKGVKFIITGSNSSLLSRDISTKLTGRYQKVELFPFSFKEYLDYKKILFAKNDIYETDKKAELKKVFLDYFKQGGMPEYLKYKEIDILKRVYEDIIYRDIVAKYGISEVKALRELALFLMSNIGNLISYNKTKDYLKLGSVNTVTKFINLLEDSYLIFSINKFAYSIKKQLIAPKKVYCIDNGINNSISFRFSKDKGAFLENLVFIHLKRLGVEIYYYITENNKEIDFLIKDGAVIKQLFQVSYDLSDVITKEREISSLITACKELDLKRGIIITENIKDKIKIDNKEIIIIPCYEFLLGEYNEII